MHNRDFDKRAFFCKCTASDSIARGIASLEFLWPGPAPRAGQFFLIKPRRAGVFLGRPISAAGWKADGAAASSKVRFIVAQRGQGSRELVDLRPGEEAELIGPLGNYWAQADILADVQDPKPVALVGGGIGIAPLLAFVGELADGLALPNQTLSKQIPFDFYAGFRSGFFGLDEIKSAGAGALVVATEDGSEGAKGRITEFFSPAEYRAVFVCGPEPLLKAAGEACTAGGVPCFVSLEKHMACGVGACLGCTVKTSGGNRRCCVEGPIFNIREVCFDQ